MKIDELKDYLNQKSSKVKTALKTGIATALTAGVLLTGVACDDQNLEVDTKEPSITDSQGNTVVTDEQGNPITTETTKKENQIIEPGDFYGEDDAEFTPVELPRDIEDCTSTEKMETFLKNYLRDETASIRFILMNEDTGINSQPAVKITFVCDSTKGEMAETNLVNTSFIFEGQENIDNLLFGGDFNIASIEDPESIESMCGYIYDVISNKYAGQDYRNYQAPALEGEYTNLVSDYSRDFVKDYYPNFELDFITIQLPTDIVAPTITPFDNYCLQLSANKYISIGAANGGTYILNDNQVEALENFIKENNLTATDDELIINRGDDPELFEKLCEVFYKEVISERIDQMEK